MFGLSSILLAIIIILISYLILRKQHVLKGYPAGPFFFPILGNLPQVALCGDVVKFMNKYRRIYGDVFSAYIGGQRVVIISGYDLFVDTYVKNSAHTSDRPIKNYSPAWTKILQSTPGLCAPYPLWKTQRSLFINLLKLNTAVSVKIETHIQEECIQFCKKYIEDLNGNPTSLTIPFEMAACNVINGLVFGGRLSYEDPKLFKLASAVNEASRAELQAAITRDFSFLPFFSSIFKSNSSANDYIIAEMTQKLEEKKRENSKGSDHDIEDMFSRMMDLRKNLTAEEIRAQLLSDKDIVMMAFQLIITGAEASSNALNWAFLYTCSYPQVMAKVQNEILEVIGRDKVVTYQDRSILPYTEATLLEILRLSNIVPVGVPHTAAVEVKVGGKIIPSGTAIWPNMSSVLHDETVFEDPHILKPERYLTGDVTLKKLRTIPFMIGKRSCTGENLARMELFIFYVYILQRYRLSFPPSKPKPSLEPHISLAAAPQEFELIFTPLSSS